MWSKVSPFPTAPLTPSLCFLIPPPLLSRDYCRSPSLLNLLLRNGTRNDAVESAKEKDSGGKKAPESDGGGNGG